MKLVRVVSLLPYWALKRLARRFDTPGHFTCDTEEGHSIFMDADYWKWCRIDMRRNGTEARDGVGGASREAGVES